ncbi:hypothetical protein LS89_10445, partial [Escherichia coli]
TSLLYANPLTTCFLRLNPFSNR